MSEVRRSKRQKNGEMICSVGRGTTETSFLAFNENLVMVLTSFVVSDALVVGRVWSLY